MKIAVIVEDLVHSIIEAESLSDVAQSDGAVYVSLEGMDVVVGSKYNTDNGTFIKPPDGGFVPRGDTAEDPLAGIIKTISRLFSNYDDILKRVEEIDDKLEKQLEDKGDVSR